VLWHVAEEVQGRVEGGDGLRGGAYEVVEPVGIGGVDEAVANPFGGLDSEGGETVLVGVE
jgi:hypothetical protein